jgi:hypothetical protein
LTDTKTTVLLGNRHPADELADVRARIRELERRESALRRIIIADPDQRDGEEFKASVGERPCERADMKALKRDFGLDALRPYLKRTTSTVVNIYNKALGRPLSPFAQRAVKQEPAT